VPLPTQFPAKGENGPARQGLSIAMTSAAANAAARNCDLSLPRRIQPPVPQSSETIVGAIYTAPAIGKRSGCATAVMKSAAREKLLELPKRANDVGAALKKQTWEARGEVRKKGGQANDRLPAL
jgi:hypothetical protein